MAEKILLKKKAEANIVDVDTSKEKTKPNTKRQYKKSKTAPKKISPNKKRNTKNAKGKCFHCGVKGHWKRNYPDYLAQKKEKK
ncbi:Zinc finger, CCHC-type, partial [Trema orientale]